jgi:hypothetical protein
MKKLLLTLIISMGTLMVYSQTSAPIDLYLGAVNKMNFVWASSGTAVTEVTTNAPYEGTTHYKIDYTVTGWYAGGGFNLNDFGFGVRQDYTNYTHMVIAWKCIGSVANTLVLTLTDSTQPANITGPPVTLSNSASYQIDTIPLSSFKGATALDLSNIHDLGWYAGTIADASTGQFYIDNVRIIDLGTAGIPEKSNSINATISPNPSTGVYSVKASENIESITVSDYLGNVVLKIENNIANSTIDLSYFPDGVYFIQLASNEKANTQKIVKSR